MRPGALARRAALLLALTATLAQAQAQEEAAPASGQNFFSRLFGGADKTVLEKAAAEPYKASNQAIGVERDLLNQRASGYGLIHHEGLEKYANGVLDKLKAASGIQGLPGKVYLVANDDLAAQTTADGNIYISYRWFENINNAQYKRGQEDTLAALLAHELGHTALGHHNSDFFSNAEKWVQKIYGEGMQIKSVLDKQYGGVSATQSGAVAGNLQKMQLMIEVTDRMLHPAWKRGQEEDADAFGVDLTRKAGYAYQEGMKRFLEINNSVEQKQIDRNQVQLKAMQEQIDLSMRAGNVDAAVSGIGKQLSSHLMSVFSAAHPDPAARTAKLSDYVNKYYKPEWYEDAEAGVSEQYRAVAMQKKTGELFDMYNTVFEHESLITSLKPEDLKAAVKLGEGMTKKIGARNINENNWLIYYQYFRALQYSGEQILAAPEPAGKKNKGAKGQQQKAMDKLLEVQKVLLNNEGMMSFKPFEDSINNALQHGNKDGAIEILRKTEKKFELARSTLPKTIAFYVRAGKPERAAELSKYCENTYIDARDDCFKAAKAK